MAFRQPHSRSLQLHAGLSCHACMPSSTQVHSTKSACAFMHHSGMLVDHNGVDLDVSNSDATVISKVL